MRKTNLSERTLELLRQARQQAKQLGHSYVGTEHLTLALLHEKASAAGRTLRRGGWEEASFRALVLAENGCGEQAMPLLQGL